IVTGQQLPTPTPTAPTIVTKDFRGFEMVYVPSGRFEIGISHDGLYDVCLNVFKDGDDEHCRQLTEIIGRETGVVQTHTVELPPFWIDRYEVTIQQYQVCVTSGPGRTCEQIDLSYMPQLVDDPRKPQLGVNWYD